LDVRIIEQQKIQGGTACNASSQLSSPSQQLVVIQRAIGTIQCCNRETKEYLINASGCSLRLRVSYRPFIIIIINFQGDAAVDGDADHDADEVQCSLPFFSDETPSLFHHWQVSLEFS